MSLALCILLGLVGWAALSLALPKHFRALRGRDPSSAVHRTLRTSGWFALAAMSAGCIASRGVEFGVIQAFVLAMLTALAWSLWLTRMTMRR
ncbi:DUF3325 domain-containing protein [Lysobacter sp. A6]|uniref:DUF3325 domain-containing protein n=1 Tax=Noviluteimonas lactosilytica TaxID=2888523 RepID=A0ABS8JEJ6_9GAMM|nr:DUF3325 domain-containing protein [Lysobacter lactosilyticus]MCC8361960.1 DUF3325 domain-containing protein [Lysobacter lactosilyticus]